LVVLTSFIDRAKLRIITNNVRPLNSKVPRMPQNVRLQPDSHAMPSTSGEVVSAQDPRDVEEVARALAAHGGGAASYDLALDLVLNGVVEEARFVTRATGAAIALARAGEMVCRASSGPDAPDLGVRVETTSGLSGACLQTGTLQQCSNTETDPRVNAEACRRLGVRSILVLPLGDGPQPFGVLEVFSSLVDAFGDRDIRELQILARRVVANKKSAESVAGSGSVVPDEILLEAAADAVQPEATPSAPELISEAAAEAPADAEYRYGRGNDVWTAVLGFLVIATAVLLGLALGWRGAIGRGFSGQVKATQTQATRSGNSSADQEAAGRPSGDGAAPAQSGSPLQPASPGGAPGAAASVEPPSGGLVVTENGKVIYQLATTADGARQEEGGSVSRLTDSRLIHRVEPEYPAEARAQKIQGLVTLEVQIGTEGAVHNIAVVDGNPMLAEAAVEAVRQWRYRPYTANGRPVEMQTRVRIRFTLPPS
jgi:TonB family protein